MPARRRTIRHMARTPKAIEMLLPPATLIPELQLLGHVTHVGARGSNLGRHRHQAAWELCWFVRGAADWWAADEVHELAAGWCYLTRPAVDHGSITGLLESCELRWLHLAEPADPLLAARLLRTPLAFPAPALGRRWEDLRAAVDRRDPLAAMAVRAALHLLLADALAAPSPQPSPAIARALARADEGRATVPALARAASMSRSVFHERFHSELGDSPAAWLRRRRLRQAKRLLLRSDQPVTAIAQACGYATSQRFATAFREAVGLTPLAWRDQARSFTAG